MSSRLKNEIKQNKPFENAYQEATINLIFTGKWMIKNHNDIFQLFGISFQQYNLLRILKGRHPKVATLNYIRVRMLDKMSDTSRIVDNMFKKGLITRSINIEDRRKADISLTVKGFGILHKIEDKQEILFGYLSNLSEKEVKQLNVLLDKARS